MTATKCTADGEALPKQFNNREEVSIPKSLNPTPEAPSRTFTWNQPLEVPKAMPVRQNKVMFAKKSAHEAHVGR